MKILDPSIRLIDALSGWGLREARKYDGMEIPSDESQLPMLGVEIVLRHVPVLIARILLAEPLDVGKPGTACKVAFGPEEADDMILHDGTALGTHADRAQKDETGFGKYVRELVRTPDLAPLVCTVQVAEDDADRRVGPIVVYDGWHRAAAWLICAREGRPYRLMTNLIWFNSNDGRMREDPVKEELMATRWPCIVVTMLCCVLAIAAATSADTAAPPIRRLNDFPR